MTAYGDALTIDESASDQRLAMAAEVLAGRDGVVLLNGAVALRPTAHEILCEVIEPMGTAHRCEEEYKVLVENASRMLSSSRLAPYLPHRRLRWRVVEDHGTGTSESWRAP
ncbi:MAG TPA: hypothetical protein PK163_06920 [Steroidobacteraceae bacterium]|nr:hypothetical protein [Steroidobacteraceae bacterium]